MNKQVITIHHSPDSDDAFMFYGFVSGKVKHPEYEFVSRKADIESLNQLARKGELEISAASVHAYAYIHKNYSLLRCAASFGGSDYGPRLVARENLNLKDGKLRKIAIPGELTSATLATKIFLKEEGIEANLLNMHFDDIQRAVQAGEVDAGVIIHEGQITHYKEGLVNIVDLGQWWWERTQLPLPLGVNIIKKSLSAEAKKTAALALKDSILCALENRSDALDYALTFGRGISKDEADQFVSMYVNERAVDMGEDGVRAIDLFLQKGFEHGILQEKIVLEVL